MSPNQQETDTTPARAPSATTPADGGNTSQAESGSPHRYDAALANAIETKWQDRWESEGTFCTPNPDAPGFAEWNFGSKQFILDMFPYPSGTGLHVGHPLGYIATDIYARYLRAKGHHVLHAMGFDAFGLPAEQFAVEHGVHPRITTENNIASMKAQLRRLGLAHDPTRSFATTDVDYYKWTQWIFLQIYNSWYDEVRDRARPIAELIDEFETGARSPAHGEFNPEGKKAWSTLDDDAKRAIIDDHRLAYLANVPVNWCPALGTVLANEEVTTEGRSERGNHPVYKRPLRQWMMRITKYAERLLHDIDKVNWPEPIKIMQRNWIGRSTGAYVDFPSDAGPIRVFTTRPDTLFGATYMVLAPEHPLVDALVADEWPSDTTPEWKGRFPNCPTGVDACSPKDVVAAYRRFAESKSDVERQIESREKTGVFIGAFATNPVNNKRIPIFIADYVLMGYGTGAIMAVPGQDERDWEFAEAFDLPIVRTVQPPDDFDGKAYIGEGPAINSDFLDGMNIGEAKKRIIEWLEVKEVGIAAVQYKLRDWLFSRQRYWGEPFPIVYDENGNAIALEENDLPVTLPELDDFTPHSSDDPDAMPQPPLARADDWVNVEIDGKTYRRETNTMPQWAGSCWYYLRYLDPHNDEHFVDPEIERYWMLSRKDDRPVQSASFDPEAHHTGGIDLYVGGAEHAVLHLLYARFWHKVLFDLGHVSTPEPFGRLFNQGYIQAFAFTDERGMYVPAEKVEEKGDKYIYEGQSVTRTYGKMGKSLKNSVTPDEMCADFGADTLRLYEMYMGPLDASKPWSTRDAVGSFRFIQRLWRNFVDEETGELRITDPPADDEMCKLLHKTIDRVDSDMHSLSFNTAIAAMIELNNAIVKDGSMPREIAESLVKMIAPFVPHVAEELWERMGQRDTGKDARSSIMYQPFPIADPKYLKVDEIQIAVQVLGKVRAQITVAADADEESVKEQALADENVKRHIEGKTIRKVIFVPGRLINIVAN